MVREELQILNGHEFFPLKGKMRKLKFPYYLVKHAQTFFFFFSASCQKLVCRTCTVWKSRKMREGTRISNGPYFNVFTTQTAQSKPLNKCSSKLSNSQYP
jgi:hypothetical protein